MSDFLKLNNRLYMTLVRETTMSFGLVEYEKGNDAQSIFKHVDTGRSKVIIG